MDVHCTAESASTARCTQTARASAVAISFRVVTLRCLQQGPVPSIEVQREATPLMQA